MGHGRAAGKGGWEVIKRGQQENGSCVAVVGSAECCCCQPACRWVSLGWAERQQLGFGSQPHCPCLPASFLAGLVTLLLNTCMAAGMVCEECWMP